MASHADRAAEKRKKRLEEIDEQVKDGSLTIRQMTPEERAPNPPRPPRERKRPR